MKRSSRATTAFGKLKNPRCELKCYFTHSWLRQRKMLEGKYKTQNWIINPNITSLQKPKKHWYSQCWCLCLKSLSGGSRICQKSSILAIWGRKSGFSLTPFWIFLSKRKGGDTRPLSSLNPRMKSNSICLTLLGTVPTLLLEIIKQYNAGT
jgi:hypothetical protein